MNQAVTYSKNGVQRRALATALGATMVTATFTTAFVVPNVAAAEVFVVESCNPGLIELRSGDQVTCIDPGGPDSGGSGGDEPRDDQGEHTDDGGGQGGRPRPKRPDAKELRRRARCKACKAAASRCVRSSTLAGSTCLSTASSTAEARCSLDARGPNGTMTPWGCSIHDLRAGLCAGAERPFNNPANWDWERPLGQSTVETLCKTAWQSDHPRGQTTDATTVNGSLTVKFDVGIGEGGAGASAERTFEVSYSWGGRLGYGSVCIDVEDAFRHACVGAQLSCYAANQCTDEDLQ